MMFQSVIRTRNGRYVHVHDTYDIAWSYIQAFMAVTREAQYEIVET